MHRVGCDDDIRYSKCRDKETLHGTDERAWEVAQGQMFVDAAKAAGVKLLVWSGLLGTNELSQGKFTNMAQRDSKAEVTRHAAASGERFVNVVAGLYMTNFVTFNAPRKQADGSYGLAGYGAPNGVQHLLDTSSDYGLYVRREIERASPAEAEDVYAFGDAISNADMAKQLSACGWPITLSRQDWGC